VDLKWLEDFISLANTGSFSRSAEERNVTQPALSRRIRALEVWLGAELIDRSTFPTTMTTAGRSFRATAEEVLTLLNQQRDEFQLEHGRTRSALRFAALKTISLTFFPRWLRNIEKHLGPLSTRLLSSDLHDCVAALSEGHCDFLLSFAHQAIPIMLDPTLFSSVHVGQDRLMPVISPTLESPVFPGTKEAPIRYLAYSANTYISRIVEHILQQHPVYHFETCYENSMAEALKAMVLEGHGVAWLPLSAITQELEQGKLLPVGGPDWELWLDIRLYRSSNRLPSLAASVWEYAATSMPTDR
jgi:DNA-binding transcriptional LysR family regulator